jgi:hypothetical protein
VNIVEFQHPLFHALQAELLTNSSALSPFYQPINSEYYKHYFNHTGCEQSFCIELGKQPLLLVKVTSAFEQQLSYFQHPILFIWRSNISATAKQGANKLAIAKLCAMAQQQAASFIYQEAAGEQLSVFAKHLLKQEYNLVPWFSQTLNLTQPEQVLFSDVRKIFRANIRWGLQQMTFKLLDANTITVAEMEDFRQLHIAVAQKETRTKQSWQWQQHMIEQSEAFAIYGYLDGKLVSTGLFPYSRTDCYYGVGAYDRNLFDQPISHALVWQAIQQAKQLGCRRFVFGESFYAGLAKSSGELPTAKELAIAHFKQGFGGAMQSVLSFQAAR